MKRTSQVPVLLLLLGNMTLFSRQLFAAALSTPSDAPKERDAYRLAANLPDVDTWPHRPVFLQAGKDTHPIGRSEVEPLPIGQPFEFETPLFRGRILVRLRNATRSDDDPVAHDAYFSGRKRLKQIVVQGRFKEPMPVSDVYFGDVYERPLRPAPPPSTARFIKASMSRLVPGLIMDLASEKPKVLTLYAGCAHTLSVDRPGHEPSITDIDLPENTELLLSKGAVASAEGRKNLLSKPKHASKYTYDTEHVYTFHNFDDIVDMGQMTMRIPILGKIDMAKILNGQPLAISAVTSDGRFVFNFRVWHERLWEP